MFHADQIKMMIIEELGKAQAKNPSYSLRALSKRIGVSQPAVSQILSGKRPLTKKTAERILSGLDRSPDEIEFILKGHIEKQTKFKTLDIDSYHLIADWHYYAILSLAETHDFNSSAKWIANRLGITLSIAKSSIDRLSRLGLLTLEPKTRKLKATGEQFEAVSAVANAALKKACRQNTELAQKALEETQFNERDFTAITLCFDPDRMAEAKAMIKTFRRTFSRIMESKNKREVYKLNVQLFPLTKRSNP